MKPIRFFTYLIFTLLTAMAIASCSPVLSTPINTLPAPVNQYTPTIVVTPIQTQTNVVPSLTPTISPTDTPAPSPTVVINPPPGAVKIAQTDKVSIYRTTTEIYSIRNSDGVLINLTENLEGKTEDIQYSPDYQWIIVQQAGLDYSDTNYYQPLDIWAITTDGSFQKKIFSGNRGTLINGWSDDNHSFATYCPNGNDYTQICAVQLLDNDVTVIRLNRSGFDDTISPNGQNIAYEAGSGSSTLLFVYNLKNGSVKQVASLHTYNYSIIKSIPLWSSDSQSIYLAHDLGGEGSRKGTVFYRMYLNGQHPKEIFYLDGKVGNYIRTISKDRTRIAFFYTPIKGIRPQLGVLRVDNNNFKTINTEGKIQTDPYNDAGFSADNSSIYWTDDGNIDIFIWKSTDDVTYRYLFDLQTEEFSQPTIINR
jgi:Tol biopolymer transport system component